MHRLQPQSALLLVIAMIFQLLAVTVASAQAVSVNAGAALYGEHPHGALHAGQINSVRSDHAGGDFGMLKPAANPDEHTLSDDCTEDSNCLQVHCSSAHALTGLYPALSIKTGILRLSVASQPRVVPLPPRVRPPKSV